MHQIKERRNFGIENKVILIWLARESYSVSLVHFRFLTSKKVVLEDASAASTVGPLSTRTDHLPTSHEEQHGIEAKCSKDTAGAEVTLTLEFG